MRDATRHPSGPAPDSWNAAFNAMPLERPDTDAWADIAAPITQGKRSRVRIQFSVLEKEGNIFR